MAKGAGRGADSLTEVILGKDEKEQMACAGMACCCFVMLILVIHGAVAGV